MTCPDCERYKQSASMWRNKAYELNGTPLPWKPRIDQGPDYERGFVDGMQYQMHSSVDKAVNRMAQPKQEPTGSFLTREEHLIKHSTTPQRTWVGLTDDEVSKLIDNEIGFNSCCGWEEEYTRAVEAKLKEKNT